MWSRSTAFSFICVAVFAASSAAPPLTALTMHECSAKYKAARQSGALGSLSWQQFRKANCGSGAPAAATSPGTGPSPSLALNPGPGAVFPQAVSPKYANQSAGKARMHTCLDQYRANKASNGNAGLRWIAKGGGYYSECNKRLKQ
jgi:hypothetical protein